MNYRALLKGFSNYTKLPKISVIDVAMFQIHCGEIPEKKTRKVGKSSTQARFVNNPTFPLCSQLLYAHAICQRRFMWKLKVCATNRKLENRFLPTPSTRPSNHTRKTRNHFYSPRAACCPNGKKGRARYNKMILQLLSILARFLSLGHD